MRPLPTGTVTLLFTDVEGSTRLLDELGAEAYAAALQEHRRRLRGAFGARGGVEVDTQGDAFFYAFPVASDALAAAREAQEALADGPIRVRMGLHTGAPTLTEEGYVGPDVHRAARIAACGHGGQVLVSAATAGAGDGNRAARPRRAPAQGSLGPGADLPARRRRVPAPQEPLPHEPPGARDRPSSAAAASWPASWRSSAGPTSASSR